MFKHSVACGHCQVSASDYKVPECGYHSKKKEKKIAEEFIIKTQD